MKASSSRGRGGQPTSSARSHGGKCGNCITISKALFVSVVKNVPSRVHRWQYRSRRSVLVLVRGRGGDERKIVTTDCVTFQTASIQRKVFSEPLFVLHQKRVSDGLR